jgi:hypothetical protein
MADAAKRCPTCDGGVTGHPNKRFCGPKCKDRYHNMANPDRYARVGIFPQSVPDHLPEDEAGWVGHKGWF